jgi:hypothetical protein
MFRMNTATNSTSISNMLACQSAMEVAFPFFLTPPHLAIGVREEGKEVNRSG